MIFVVDDIAFDCGALEITRAGRVIEVGPKVFEFLRYLIEHRDRVVAKDELLDAVWDSGFVGESVLTRCASVARKALGDSAIDPRYLKTVYGKGYRFIGAVRVRSAPVVSAGSVEPPGASVPAQRGAGQGAARRVFVAREAELTRADAAAQAALDGRGQLVLVCGEAGVGKTRLCEELADRQAQRGMIVCWGRSSEADGAPAYWPFIQIVRGLRRAPELGDLPLPAGLAAFAPGAGPRGGSPPASHSEHGRFALFDQLGRFLAAAGRRAPLLLVIDDLHRADIDSLLLLEFLVEHVVAQGRLLMLGAYREAELRGQSDKLDVLARVARSRAEVLRLSGLPLSAVRRWLSEQYGGEAKSEVAQRLHELTGGNPFFLTQLIPQVSQGAVPAPNTLPATVKDAIVEQVRQLAPEVLRLLVAGAVIGREFEVAVACRACGLSEAEGARMLGDARVAHVVFAEDGQPGCHRFVHVLVREVLYERLRSEERARLHLAVARAIETLHRADYDEWLAELAYHYSQGSEIGGAERAIDCAIHAGSQALANLAYEQAAEHFELAGRLLSLHPPEDDRTLCTVLLDLGTAQLAAGRRDAAQASIRRAAKLARTLGAADSLARAALSMAPGVLSIQGGHVDQDLIELLESAIELLGDGDPDLGVRLRARLAVAKYWSGATREIRELCDQAERLLPPAAGGLVRATTTTARLISTWRHDNLGERLALAERAQREAAPTGDNDLKMVVYASAFTVALESGDAGGAHSALRTLESILKSYPTPQLRWFSLSYRASLALAEGRLADVEAIANEYFPIGTRIRDHNAAHTFALQMFWVRYEQDRIDEVFDLLLEHTMQATMEAWRNSLPHTLVVGGRKERGQRELDALGAKGFSFPSDTTWFVPMSLSVLTSVELDYPRWAPLLYEKLEPFSGSFVVAGYGASVHGCVHRYLGLLSTLMQDVPRAEQHYRKALRANRDAGLTVQVAWTQYDYGRTLATRDCALGAVSGPLLDAALTTARALGLLRLQRKVERFLKDLHPDDLQPSPLLAPGAGEDEDQQR